VADGGLVSDSMLWNKRDGLKKKIEQLLIRKGCISHYTPFGAAFKVRQ
jgi:hypothetical protein